MNLRELTIEKIDGSGGRSKLINELEKYSRILTGRPCREINTMILYIELIYEFEIDVKSDFISRRPHLHKHLDLPERLIKRYNSHTLIFLRDLIRFNLEQLENIQRLTG